MATVVRSFLWITLLNVSVGLSSSASEKLTACGWVPGDAFFAASGFRTEGGAENMALVFVDISLQGTPAFRDYAGFHFLKVTGEITPVLAALRRVPAPPEDLFFLVYNKAFLHSQGRFGLKYNEDWFRPPQQAATQRKSFPATGCYTSLVNGAEAVQLDWRLSARFEGLTAKLPQEVTDWARPGELIRTPAHIPVTQIAVVVVRRSDIEKLCLKRETVSAWVIEHSGATLTLTYKQGQRKLAAGMQGDEASR
ncbi:MAG: hypothetical protein NXI04_17100 [Planctomycetaceae bacterium]|nr:hypothetical protein [Planctomycetaceae bacterium]